MKTLLAFSVSFFILVVSSTSTDSGNLQPEFYRLSCPEVESLVRAVTWAHVALNPVLPAKLLRLHFHDCVVRGCDGSVLLDTIPGGNEPAEKEAHTQFAGLNLTVRDLVALSGAHTVGRGHCSLITNRIYNFKGRPGSSDPTLSATYAAALRALCSQNDNTTTVEMDPKSSHTFDTSYFSNLKLHKGLFTSDAALITDEASTKIVSELSHPAAFMDQFGRWMRKMVAIGVLTGSQGEIRRSFRVINN